jgi:hypothetical protein
MFRWWFIGLVVSAILMQFAPAAYADCGAEGGDSTRGHSAIAYCCDMGDRARGDGHGKAGQSRTVSGIHAR